MNRYYSCILTHLYLTDWGLGTLTKILNTTPRIQSTVGMILKIRKVSSRIISLNEVTFGLTQVLPLPKSKFEYTICSDKTRKYCE